ncbi:Flp pilus assembly protein, pilin Flp [Rhizobiales bacterium GAS188]|nr:Flp pilus assembly protein, pilin Flp [Rhizobiales bacterium GAS188]
MSVFYYRHASWFGHVSANSYKEPTFMMPASSRFAQDESGATAIEYGLIAPLISVVIIGVLTSVGTSLTATFTSMNTALTTAN